MAALWMDLQDGSVGLIYQTLVDAYFNNQRIAVFLDVLMREIPHPVIVIWDRGNMHRGDPIRGQVERFRPRLSLEVLPAYAPMLNPVEQVFRWLKRDRLCNFAPTGAHELNRAITAELRVAQEDQSRLWSFWHASELPFRRRRFD